MTSLPENFYYWAIAALVIILPAVLIAIRALSRRGCKGTWGCKKLCIVPGNAQNIGQRKEQQDSFGLSELGDWDSISAKGFIAVVADGMGGMEKGRETSELAVETILESFSRYDGKESIDHALLSFAVEANNRILKTNMQNGQEGNSGTTLVCAAIKGEKLYWLSIGDSRIYLFRDGELARLTKDHNYGLELDRDVQKGLISEEEARDNPQRNALVSYLGTSELKYIDRNLGPCTLKAGDMILLCSDGLYGPVESEDIRKILGNNARVPQLAAEKLVSAALKAGSKNQDNITVVIVKFLGNKGSETQI